MRATRQHSECLHPATVIEDIMKDIATDICEYSNDISENPGASHHKSKKQNRKSKKRKRDEKHENRHKKSRKTELTNLCISASSENTFDKQVQENETVQAELHNKVDLTDLCYGYENKNIVANDHHSFCSQMMEGNSVDATDVYSNREKITSVHKHKHKKKKTPKKLKKSRKDKDRSEERETRRAVRRVRRLMKKNYNLSVNENIDLFNRVAQPKLCLSDIEVKSTEKIKPMQDEDENSSDKTPYFQIDLKHPPSPILILSKETEENLKKFSLEKPKHSEHEISNINSLQPDSPSCVDEALAHDKSISLSVSAHCDDAKTEYQTTSAKPGSLEHNFERLKNQAIGERTDSVRPFVMLSPIHTSRTPEEQNLLNSLQEKTPKIMLYDDFIHSPPLSEKPSKEFENVQNGPEKDCSLGGNNIDIQWVDKLKYLTNFSTYRPQNTDNGREASRESPQVVSFSEDYVKPTTEQAHQIDTFLSAKKSKSKDSKKKIKLKIKVKKTKLVNKHKKFPPFPEVKPIGSATTGPDLLISNSGENEVEACGVNHFEKNGSESNMEVDGVNNSPPESSTGGFESLNTEEEQIGNEGKNEHHFDEDLSVKSQLAESDYQVLTFETFQDQLNHQNETECDSDIKLKPPSADLDLTDLFEPDKQEIKRDPVVMLSDVLPLLTPIQKKQLQQSYSDMVYINISSDNDDVPRAGPSHERNCELSKSPTLQLRKLSHDEYVIASNPIRKKYKELPQNDVVSSGDEILIDGGDDMFEKTDSGEIGVDKTCDSSDMMKKLRPRRPPVRQVSSFVQEQFRKSRTYGVKCRGFKHIALKRLSDYSEIVIVVESISKRTKTDMCLPKEYNYLGVDALKELIRAFTECKLDRKCKAVLLSSVGPIFCSGLSPISVLNSSSEDENDDIVETMKELVEALINFNKPIIASVQGPAVGFGASVLLFCDSVYASERATFQWPHTKQGITPFGCSSVLLPEVVGRIRARSLLLEGRVLTSKEAKEIGLVTEVFPHDSLVGNVLPRCRSLATTLVCTLYKTKMLLGQHSKKNLISVNNDECLVLKECLESEMNRINLENYIVTQLLLD